MEASQRHWGAFTRFCAFVALALISSADQSFAQAKTGSFGEKTDYIISKIDAAAAKEFQRAWHASRNGSDGFEGLVLLYSSQDGSISAKAQGKSNEPNSFKFGWTADIIAVVHTHPNGVDPKPNGQDLRLADKFGVPVFTLTQRGMYVYDPSSKRVSMIQEGLDWLESKKWKNEQIIGQKQ